MVELVYVACMLSYGKYTLRSLLFKVTIFCELVVWRILRVLLSPHAQVVYVNPCERSRASA